jgi:hypothetical protein
MKLTNNSLYLRIAAACWPDASFPASMSMTAKSPAASSFGKAEAGELRNVGDPVELALRYNEQGADEMVFFDITASAHGRATMMASSSAPPTSVSCR